MIRLTFLFAAITLLSLPAAAQNTIDLTGRLVITEPDASTEQFVRTLLGTGPVGTLGNATIVLTMTQNSLTDDYSTGKGPVTSTLQLMFNSMDQLHVGFLGVPIPDPDFTTFTVPGTVANTSSGVYAGATSAGGAVRLTLARTSTSPLRYNLSLAGPATVGGQPVILSIVNVPVTLGTSRVNLFDTEPGTCAIPAIGNGTLTLRSRPDSNSWDERVRFIEVNFLCSFPGNNNL